MPGYEVGGESINQKYRIQSVRENYPQWLHYEKYIFIALYLISMHSTPAQSAQKDMTYSACQDVIENGLEKASIENQLYLIGKENGIETGITLAYKNHNIKDPLPASSSYPYIIDEACKAVIVDKSDRRAMTVFNEEVFKLYTKSQ